jgi:predicted nucleic acid-binding protein
MRLYFFDTSALVKRYYEEDGTKEVDSIIEDEQNQVIISSLSIIETTSAFRRKRNTREITADEVNELLGAFFKEALDDFIIIPLEESILSFSFNLILEEDLRTLDSLQLSAAISVDSETDELAFVCADADLVSVANSNGLDAINPTKI